MSARYPGPPIAPRPIAPAAPPPIPDKVERAPIPGGHDPVARAAVDEVFGPRGPGPFPSGSGLTRGGRASMPVEYSEERAVDRQLEAGS